MKRRWTVGILPCLLSACALTPPAPVTLCQPGLAAEADNWWQAFGDSVLLAYLNEARQCNVKLAHLRLQVERHRLDLDQPDRSLKGRVETRFSQPLAGDRVLREQPSFHLEVTYEVDLWGRAARSKVAQQWLVRASELEWRALQLSTAAEVVQRYWLWAAYRQQVALAAQMVEIRLALLQLYELAYIQGGRAASEVYPLRLELNNARESYASLLLEQASAAKQLAELLERASIDGMMAPAVLPEQLPGLPAELAANALMRRPDVAAAAARVEHLLARYDQARLNPLPRLTLAGSLGAINSSFTGFAQQTVAAGIVALDLPFLDWRQRVIEREQARLDWAAATLSYESTVKQALRETEDVLRWVKQARDDVQRTEESLQFARQLERDAHLAWQAGATGREAWLQASLYRLSVESARVRGQQAQMMSLAQLYKALGGPPTPL